MRERWLSLGPVLFLRMKRVLEFKQVKALFFFLPGLGILQKKVASSLYTSGRDLWKAGWSVSLGPGPGDTSGVLGHVTVVYRPVKQSFNIVH